MNASDPTPSADGSAAPQVSDLESLIDQRLVTLQTLLSLTDRQEEIIGAGHMSPLMPLLAEKQRWIEAFVDQSTRLVDLRHRFPEPPALSTLHRQRHQQCDQLHRELLEREAGCEQQLTSSRDILEQQLTQSQGVAHAVSRYNEVGSDGRAGPGGALDLSNDG